MFRHRSPNIPDSPEYLESADLVRVNALSARVSELERVKRARTARIFIGGIVVGLLVPFAVRAGSSLIDNTKSEPRRDVAADYPFPPEGYEATCANLSQQAKEMADRLNLGIVEMYANSADITNQEFAITTGKTGSYGYLSFDLPVINGSYSASAIVASDGKGSADPNSGYTTRISAESETGIKMSVDLGIPPVGDHGGPNFPIEVLEVSTTAADGQQTYYSWEFDSTPEQCQSVYDHALPIAEQLLRGLMNHSPVEFPA